MLENEENCQDRPKAPRSVTASDSTLFHVMGAIAEFERSLISDRTRAGMAAAKARGRHLGRESKMSDEDTEWAKRMIELGRMTPHDVARALRVAPLTIEVASPYGDGTCQIKIAG